MSFLSLSVEIVDFKRERESEENVDPVDGNEKA